MTSLPSFGVIVVGQVTVISVTAILLMAFCWRSAARRHAIGLLALVLVLSSPLLVLVLPQTNVWRTQSQLESAVPQTDPILVERETDLASRNQSAAIEQTNSAVVTRPVIEPSLHPPASTTKLRETPAAPLRMNVTNWLNWLLSLVAVTWIAGSVVSMSRWIWQTWQLRWIGRSLSTCSPAELQVSESVFEEVRNVLRLRQLPPIAISDVVPSPIVLGMWHPTIVLPRVLLHSVTVTRLRDVLIHECAHVVRRDPWVNAAQRLAAVLWWWHPGVLGLNRSLARAREEVCDNFVLQHGDALNYAQTLLELAEQYSDRNRPLPVLGLLGSRWTLEERITGLLKPGRNTMTRTKRRTVVLVAGLLGTLCWLVGGVQAVEEPAPVSERMPTIEVIAEPQKTAEEIATSKPAATPLRKLVIRGTCLDDDLEPVAKAWVRIYRHPRDIKEPPPVLLAETRSDPNGNFVISDLEMKESIGAGLMIVASADRHASQIQFTNDPKNDVCEVSVTLSSTPGSLSGRVVDSRGKPIKGVTVFMTGFSAYPISGIQSAITDAQGRYAISDLKCWSQESTKTFDPKTQTGTTNRRCVFLLKHPDYAVTRAWMSGIPQEVNVTLQPPAIVEGQVIDAVTQQPAVDVVVSAQGIAGPGWYQAVTDNHGRYRLLMTKDHYNIWATADDRIPVAVKALKVEPGKTISNTDIRLVRGGFVVGKVLNEDGTPRARLSVAHYGPARPRTGASVTATMVNADGTYRLHVAPGRNYVYLRDGSNDGMNVMVEEGQEVTLDFQGGVTSQSDSYIAPASDPDYLLRMKILREVELESEPVKDKATTQQPRKRQRSDSPTDKLLDLLEDQNYGSEQFTNPWLLTLKQIVDLGPAAVPDLISELDATRDDMMLRCLGFTLRAIGDKRAIPALIRAIPKTLLPPISDMGLTTTDSELLKFAQRHDRSEQNRGSNNYDFGRPVNEILGALIKLTGQKFDQVELWSSYTGGFPPQQRAKKHLFYRVAKQSADWWEKHWSDHVKDEAYSRVKLPAIDSIDEPWTLTPSMKFKTNSSWGGSNHLLGPILDTKARRVFYDFDTGRHSNVPEKWRDANLEAHMNDILTWAAGEGFDMLGRNIPRHRTTSAITPCSQLVSKRGSSASRSGDRRSQCSPWKKCKRRGYRLISG